MTAGTVCVSVAAGKLTTNWLTWRCRADCSKTVLLRPETNEFVVPEIRDIMLMITYTTCDLKSKSQSPLMMTSIGLLFHHQIHVPMGLSFSRFACCFIYQQNYYNYGWILTKSVGKLQNLAEFLPWDKMIWIRIKEVKIIFSRRRFALSGCFLVCWRPLSVDASSLVVYHKRASRRDSGRSR